MADFDSKIAYVFPIQGILLDKRLLLRFSCIAKDSALESNLCLKEEDKQKFHSF